MARVKGCEAVYEVAGQWRERCLEQDGSLLWPDLEERTWTVENLEALLDAFIGNPDDGSDSFTEKWRRQLGDQAEAVHRLAADAMVVYSLFPSNRVISPGKKIELVNEVASWKVGLPPASDSLRAAFAEGVGHPGMYYQTGRPWQVAFYLAFARLVKERGVDSLDKAEMKMICDELLGMQEGASAARNIILHLLFPNDFERIASRDHKRRIVDAFRRDRDLSLDVDDALKQIREGLKVEYDRGDVDFYDSDIRPRWDLSSETPPPLVPSPGRRVWIEKAQRWQSPNDPAIRSGSVLFYPTKDASGHSIWESLNELQAGDVVLHLFDKQSFAQRSLVQSPAIEIDGGPVGYPGKHYLVQLTNTETIDPELNWESVKESDEPRLLEIAETCGEALFFLPREGLKLRSPEGVTPAPPSLIAALNAASQKLLIMDILPSGWPQNDPVEPLAEVVLMTRGNLTIIASILNYKKHLILEGPPGSGKTFIADRFARYFTGNLLEGEHNDQIELVQFHQSYGYEDFVQGIRPVTEGGTLTYRVVPGIFLEMCERAEARPDDKFVLIIDEITVGTSRASSVSC
jgi:5-methylcytosine-specific restriction protein B